MDFSKLDDTRFPNFDTTEPYALKNTFDYTRWVPNTKIHMVNVLWNGDYSNVVKFSDDGARDAWFDGIEDAYVTTLKSNARIVPDGTVKLPLPYDVAARYNYLYVEIPIATSQDNVIQFENPKGVRRWYFFVGDVSYSAPNTTIVTLQPDVWTNFIGSARISYMMLQRGHAPVANSDTDAYLANPIANNRYLLAPDVNYDDSDVVRDSRFIPFGNGTKYVCFASTVSFQHLMTGVLGTVTKGSSTGFSDPTFSDTSDWFGYQLQVNGYGFGGDGDYSNLYTDAGPYLYPDDNLPTSLDIYAVRATDNHFLEAVRKQCPVFLRTIKAVFVADENMIDLFQEIDFCGYKIWYIHGRDRDLGTYDLTRGMFGFTPEEQRFAKLYTYPYSRLEISDNNGKTVEVRIENTGKIGIKALSMITYPVLDIRVLFSGINGVGSNTYSWKKLDDSDVREQLPYGDWDKCLLDLDVPTFSLYMDARTAWLMDNYSGMQASRARALAAYHNAVRSANSDYTNSVASADTAQANTNASADTAKTNDVASANTAKTNANASAATTKSNADNLAECASDNMTSTIEANDANTRRAGKASRQVTAYQMQDNTFGVNQTNALNTATTQAENETSVATTQTTGNYSIVSGALSGGQSGAMAGAMSGAGFLGSLSAGIAGAAMGAFKEGISAAAANTNAIAMAGTNTAIAAKAGNTNAAIASHSNSTTLQSTGEMADSALDQTINTNDSLKAQRDNNYTTNTTNNENLKATQDANATRTNTTATANAGRTYDTATENATRTHDNSTTNSTRSRQIQVLNAQESLRATQHDYRGQLGNADCGMPVQLASASGDARQWAYHQLGVQFRLRTQGDSAIAQTAAQFARYGYALNQIWDVSKSGLCMMKHFTYWKAADIWVDVRDVASSQVGDELSEIFENGVTVWSNPDEIGKVGIYDN